MHNCYLDQATIEAINVGSIDFTNHALVREITQFMWLWPYFENLKCCENANPDRLRDFSRVCPAELWDQESLAKRFFGNRYLQQPDSGCRLNALIGDRAGQMRQPIQQGLDENSGPAEARTALLFVVYRLRNNLFHGGKLQNNMDNQFENFDQANKLLRCWLQPPLD